MQVFISWSGDQSKVIAGPSFLHFAERTLLYRLLRFVPWRMGGMANRCSAGVRWGLSRLALAALPIRRLASSIYVMS